MVSSRELTATSEIVAGLSSLWVTQIRAAGDPQGLQPNTARIVGGQLCLTEAAHVWPADWDGHLPLRRVDLVHSYMIADTCLVPVVMSRGVRNVPVYHLSYHPCSPPHGCPKGGGWSRLIHPQISPAPRRLMILVTPAQ